MKKDITIIIPVYNSEKYLNRCIDSIINQTAKNYKILIINDGSKDNSQKIIDDYCKKYPKIIKCVKQKNKGVAKTRNNAIKLTDTKYIMFMDNDDYIDVDYVETLYKNIKDYDIVLSGFRRPNSKGVITTETNLQDEEWSKMMIMTPWAKIFKREFLIDNNIEFLDNNIGEDIYFNLLAVFSTKKIKVLNYIGYNWFYNDESVSNTSQTDIKKINVYNLLNNCYDELKKRELLIKNYTMIEAHFIRYIYWFMIYATKNLNYKDLSKEYDKIFKWLKDRFPNYEKNKLIGFNKPKGETFENKRLYFIFKTSSKFKLGKLFVFMYNKIKNYRKEN